MDTKKNLVFLNGEDKTDDIKWIEGHGGLLDVTFKKGTKSYKYKRERLKWIQLKREYNTDDKVVMVKDFPEVDVTCILDFGRWYRLIYRDGAEALHHKEDIRITEKNDVNTLPGDRFASIKQTAQVISLKVEEDYNILGAQYNKITEIPADSVLASYLKDDADVKKYDMPKEIIYPFGINRSQKLAVENAMTSQVSIIEGPPGTGKTQTILNIIANVVKDGKTIAVVSNNNTATQNVQEKMAKYRFDFQTAFLGSTENKKKFMEAQMSYPKEMQSWEMKMEERLEQNSKLKKLTAEINEKLSLKNRLAKVRLENSELETEYTKFKESNHLESLPKVEKSVSGMRTSNILDLMSECENRAIAQKPYGILERIKMFLKYKKKVTHIINGDPRITLPYLRDLFYRARKQELQEEQRKLNKGLEGYSFDEKMNQMTVLSRSLYEAGLYRKYGRTGSRKKFVEADLRKHSGAFVKEYPVILSTTYSIKKTLNRNFIYDYIVVDEASQVDLATGVLAMSCARNIVIVGDLKQLPNVVTKENIERAEMFWEPRFGEAYRFSTQSLLSSAEKVWSNVPSVLLREHYRCSPKIINFCNIKFYDNALVIMTEEDATVKPLKLYRTPAGNHERDNSNQREIDIIKNEILPSLKGISLSDVGIITPYRNQVKRMKRQLPSKCEIDTVHKFQGREKDVIILSSVANNTSQEFVNDPNLLNVAVSRAEKALIVVTSGNPGNENTNYGALAKYIQYNNLEVVDSKVQSVFDLLYKQYYTARREFLKRCKKISEYDSENLMYELITNVIKNNGFDGCDCACHVALRDIVKDFSGFSEEERSYCENPLTHTDFLIFDKMDKSPVLAVEVDGTSFHRKDTRQDERDSMKDSIFHSVGIPLIRFRTDESGEEERLIKALGKVLR